MNCPGYVGGLAHGVHHMYTMAVGSIFFYLTLTDPNFDP